MENSEIHSQKNMFVTASLVCGVIAFMTLYLIIPPIILGALSVLFAILSKGSNTSMHTMAKIGISASIVSFLLAISIGVASSYMIINDPQFREQLNTTSESPYGVTFDDMIDEIKGNSNK